ncbi:sulfite exporter TauE/SafE family protein [Inediibacterium massiliense]|uniref:sulfite exporter TauE/SafE family protein n=1 Tax=Inediibacterium massiliense TaxID=1658111 RepID=UPI0006B59174|nr:sulfite exporter TauE/SafE family protein [Inediibacterium massiliense]
MKKNLFTFRFIVLGILTGILNGLFGSGGGTILILGLLFILDIDQHKAHATSISVILPLAIVSAYIYLRNGMIAWDITKKVILGGIIGGYIGAKLLSKIPEKYLRKIFALFMIVAAVRMVFSC